MKQVMLLLVMVFATVNLLGVNQEKKLMQKLKSIRLKHIEYQDAPIDDVIKALQKRIKDLDSDGSGVNMIVAVAKGEKADNYRVNLNLSNLPLYNALDYISRSANMQFFLRENTVVIASKEIAREGMEIRTYKVKPHTVSTLKRIYPNAKIDVKKNKGELEAFDEDKEDIFK